jgi:hypothetical protein
VRYARYIGRVRDVTTGDSQSCCAGPQFDAAAAHRGGGWRGRSNRRRAGCTSVCSVTGAGRSDGHVYDICNSYRPGYRPVVALGTLGELICIPGGALPVAGLSDSLEGRVRAGNLPGLPPGSYRVNPLDPFSDWVIPG